MVAGCPAKFLSESVTKKKSFINTGHLVSNKSMGTSLKKFLRREAAGTEKNGITVDFETTSWSCKSE